MKAKFYLLLILIAVEGSLYGQNLENEYFRLKSPGISFSDPTYITLRGGLGNIEPLKYEVNFAPRFNIEMKRFANLGFEFTPQIILRMYDQYSNPVRTPSYMPKGTLYYHFSDISPDGDDLIPFLTIGHHSNGQDGEFYNSDGTINKINGSFSSNYGTLGVLLTSSEEKEVSLYKNARLSFCYYEIYQPVLRQLYGKVRFYGDLESSAFVSREKSDLFTQRKSRSLLKSNLHVGWIASDLIYAQTFDWKRLIVSWTLSYEPAWLSQISFFTRFYYGQDYYNINFDRTLRLMQVGFSIRNLGF